MTRLVPAAALALAPALVLAAGPLAAQTSRVLGAETTIPYSSGGAIRTYQVDDADPSIVYLQDRTLRWYRVTMSGPCLPHDGQAALITRTTADNRLDRTSSIGSSRYPGRICGVESIVNSLPPAGQPGAPKPNG